MTTKREKKIQRDTKCSQRNRQAKNTHDDHSLVGSPAGGVGAFYLSVLYLVFAYKVKNELTF